MFAGLLQLVRFYACSWLATYQLSLGKKSNKYSHLSIIFHAIHVRYPTNPPPPYFHRCNGIARTCPPRNVAEIHLQEGQANITFSNFVQTIVFQSNTDKLHLKLSGFSVTCGSLVVKWSLIKAEENCHLPENSATLPSNTDNHVITGLKMQNTERYKIVVQAYDIR